MPKTMSRKSKVWKRLFSTTHLENVGRLSGYMSWSRLHPQNNMSFFSKHTHVPECMIPKEEKRTRTTEKGESHRPTHLPTLNIGWE